MFRVRQKFEPAGYFPAVLPQVTVNEVDEVSVIYRDESDCKLPSPDTTRLGDVLKAGVDLKQVNTALFKPESLELEVGSNSESQETTNTNKGENE